jgi:hypothetical protein
MTENSLFDLDNFFKPMIKKQDMEIIIKILKKAVDEELEHTFCGKPENYLIVEIDRLRNMMFYEGITQDIQCFVSCAYDLDEFIINGNFRVLTDVAEHFEKMIQEPNFTCKNNILTDQWNFLDKLKWYNHFKKETKNFTYLVGWNSFTIKSLQTSYNMTWKDSDHIEDFPI